MFDYDVSDKPRYSPWAQVAILLCLCGAGLLIGGLVSALLVLMYIHVPAAQMKDALLSSNNANFLRLFQFITTFFFMALPALIFCKAG